MQTLQYIGQGHYLDTHDNRPLLLLRAADDNGLLVCVHKLITPSDCLRPSVRDSPDLQPTEAEPFRFHDETSHHSCGGDYWHVHLPVDSRTGALLEELPENLSIDGIVQNPDIVEGVELRPQFREELQALIDREGADYTPENVIRYNALPLCPVLYEGVMVTPFTLSRRERGSGTELYTKTKTCGHAHSDNEADMELPIVRGQMEAKRTDIRRLYADLASIDLTDIPIVPMRAVLAEIEALMAMSKSLLEL